MRSVPYFLLNKEQDFIEQESCLCSNLLDSEEKQTEWSRIKLSVEDGEMVRVRVYVSEQDWIAKNGERQDIRQMLRNEDMKMQEKLCLFSPYEVLYTGRETDYLLQQAAGRYLWLVIESNQRETIREKKLEIQIFFQADSWVSYLPEIYGRGEEKDSFLSRYLGIFQWMYYDMTQKILAMPHMLYPAHAETEFLEWMAEWFGLENINIWSKQQLIYLLENGRRLFGIRGTKQYLKEVIWLFTGYVPFIVEYYQTQKYKTDIKKQKRLERLYGENAYVVTIVLPQNAVLDRQRIAMLNRVIHSASPAYIECRLVVLESYIFLDRYAYIGINSRLGGYRNIRLDNSGLMPYISVIGKKG